MVTGERPDPAYFAEYLTRKFEGIYGLPEEPIPAAPAPEASAAKPAKATARGEKGDEKPKAKK
jgi:hypothetical protein